MRALLGHRSALVRSELCESLLRSNLRTQMWKAAYCETTFPLPGVHEKTLHPKGRPSHTGCTSEGGQRTLVVWGCAQMPP